MLVNCCVFFFGIHVNLLQQKVLNGVDYLVTNVYFSLCHTVVSFGNYLTLMQQISWSTCEKNGLTKTTSPWRRKLREEQCFLSCEIARNIYFPEASKFQETNLFDHTYFEIISNSVMYLKENNSLFTNFSVNISYSSR